MNPRKPTRKDCSGCYNNFYNLNDMGANLNKKGKPECWSLETAEFVSAMDIPTQLPPPYKNFPKTKRPSCYRAKGYVRVKSDALTRDGYWKY